MVSGTVVSGTVVSGTVVSTGTVVSGAVVSGGEVPGMLVSGAVVPCVCPIDSVGIVEGSVTPGPLLQPTHTTAKIKIRTDAISRQVFCLMMIILLLLRKVMVYLVYRYKYYRRFVTPLEKRYFLQPHVSFAIINTRKQNQVGG